MKQLPFEIAENRRLRVIIDTDAACEADDQYAIAHALMSGKIRVRGITAEHFGSIPGSMEQSAQEIRRVCGLMGCTETAVLEGASSPMPAENCAQPSPASRFIVEEAMREDPEPLFLLCQGALTNVASALLEAPQIQERVQIIMVAGCCYPTGKYEFNTMNDPAAFNAVMNSRASLWVIPEEVYATMQAGMLELFMRVGSCGEIGRYLYERTAETACRMARMIPADPEVTAFESVLGFPNGESWSLGDSAAIGLLLMHHGGEYREVPAPNVRADGTYLIADECRKVRWYTSINYRMILEDFFAKIAWFYGGR